MKKKVALISFYGSKNIGDNLIVYKLQEDLTMRYEVVGYNSGLNQFSETIESKGILEDNEKKIGYKIYQKYFRNLLLIDFLHKIKNNFRIKKNPNLRTFEENLSEYSVVFIGGGNLVYDQTRCSDSIYSIKLIVDICKKNRVPVVFLSIGIGPFVTENQIDRTYNVLSSAEFVTFRDKQYLEYFKDKDTSNFYLSSDPILTLPKLSNEKSAKKNKIAICVMDYRLNKCTDKEYYDYCQSLVSLSKKLITAGFNVVFFSTAREDYPTVKSIFKNVPNSEISILNSTEDLFRFLKDVKMVIGTRMHSLIVSFSQSIPFIGFSWQPKVTSLFELLERTSYCYDINKINSLEKDILKKVDSIIDNYEENISFIEYKKSEIDFQYSINSRLIYDKLKD